jgi:hypothetical protein
MATFEAFALKCATGVALEVLAAIAAVESGLQPMVVRDGAKVTVVSSAGEGVALVVGAGDSGREIGVGLFGLTERQLAAAGVSIAEAFDVCASMRAAEFVFSAAAKDALKRGLIGPAVDRTAVRAWWKPDGRFRSSELYERAVDAQRAGVSVLAGRDMGPMTKQRDAVVARATAESAPVSQQAVPAKRPKLDEKPTGEPPCWDVFARARFGKQC